MRSKGKTYQEIGGILGLTMFSVRRSCTHERRVSKKRRQKFLLGKAKCLAIKRKIESLKCSNQKIVCSRIFKDLNLKVSVSMLQRHLIRCDYKYKKAKLQIILSNHHKHERTKIIGDWITENHDWSKNHLLCRKAVHIRWAGWLANIPQENRRYY